MTSPLRRLLDHHYLKSPLPRVTLLPPRPLTIMDHERLFPRYHFHESLGPLAHPLNLKNTCRVLSPPGRGNCDLMGLQMLLSLCLSRTSGNRLLLPARTTPTTPGCQCLPQTLRPPWTWRPMLGKTHLFVYLY